MQEKIVLLNCLADDIISGGNIYNKHLIQGLQDLGLEAEQQIVDSSASWVDSLNDRSVYLLDSILLRYPLDWEKLIGIKVAVLLHMCPSLDSDLSVEEKAAFRLNEITAYQNLPIISTGANNLNYISEVLEIQPEHAVVIPPAVPSDWIKCEHLPNAPTRLLTIGSVTKGKGLERTIQVLQNIQHIDWTWSHYGPARDEELFAELQKQVTVYNMNDRVQFLGAIGHGKVNDILLDHHLLLHLSDHENYGMAIMESIATGVPCVFTPVGDHKYWRNSGLGWVSNGFGEIEIASLLSKVMQDTKEYRAMAEHLKTIDITTWASVAERTLQFIQSSLC